MLVVIAILQLIMIGILLNINGKLKPRDYIADAMERDRKSAGGAREEAENGAMVTGNKRSKHRSFMTYLGYGITKIPGPLA